MPETKMVFATTTAREYPMSRSNGGSRADVLAIFHGDDDCRTLRVSLLPGGEMPRSIAKGVRRATQGMSQSRAAHSKPAPSSRRTIAREKTAPQLVRRCVD